MNPSQDTSEVRTMNKIIVGTLLLFVIVGSGVYGTMKFLEVYNILSAPVENPVAARLDNEDKEALLMSVSPNVENIEEKEKLDMLTKLSVKQDEVDIRSRTAILDSLK